MLSRPSHTPAFNARFAVLRQLLVPHVLSLLLGAGSGLAGCTPAPPVVNNPVNTTLRKSSAFADVVLNYGNEQATISCADGLPVCNGDGSATAQTGDCAGNPALGKPDGKVFDIGPVGRIEIGLFCSLIVEVGGTGASPDFKLWATVDAGAQPVVEVSLDGLAYIALNPWPIDSGYIDNPGFELEAQQLSDTRYVRVTNASTTGKIHLDALEALPVLAP